LLLCEIGTAHGKKNNNTTMKKTLLIAAAALAASVISSQAQVYSQNVVGYVNIPETAGQFSLETPAMDPDGTGTNGTVIGVYPNPAVGDQIYVFNATSGVFLNYTYQFKAASHGNPASTNWVDGTGANANGFSLNVGQGVFYLPIVNETNTFVGLVVNGTVTNSYVPAPNSFALIASQIPYGGGISSTLGYVPSINDTVYTFTGGAYTTYTYQFKPASHGNPASTNWVDGTGAVSEPQISAGQGFWLDPVQTPVWSQTFTNN